MKHWIINVRNEAVSNLANAYYELIFSRLTKCLKIVQYVEINVGKCIPSATIIKSIVLLNPGGLLQCQNREFFYIAPTVVIVCNNTRY